MDPLAFVETDKLVELTKTLISTSSVSGKEHELVDWIEKYFKSLGMTDIKRFPVEEAGDTLIGWINGTGNGPTLMLNFHIDTFNAFDGWETDPLSPVVQNGRLYGLGAHDMKGGTACLLSVVQAIVKSGVEFNGKLLISATTDEENWSRGAHALINSGVLKDVDYCIVPEQSKLGTMTIGQLGRHVFHLQFYGKAVHAVFEGGINAVVDASKVALAISTLDKSELGYMHEYNKHGSICVTGLKGGGTDILVPEYAELWVDRYILPNQTLEEAANHIHDIVKRTGIKSKYQLTWDERPTPAPTSYITSEESTLVKTVAKNLSEVSGMKVVYLIETSVADTNHIAVHGGVPTVILGPDGGNTCEANEYVEIASLPIVTKTIIRSVLDLLT